MAKEEVILKAEGLTKEFKGFVAVNNVNLAIELESLSYFIQ